MMLVVAEAEVSQPLAASLFRLSLASGGISYLVNQPPLHGTLSGTPPNLVYTPEANYSGPDSFFFQVSDGSVGSGAKVSITVTPVNDAPVAVDDAYATDEDTVLVVASPGMLGNDADVDAGAPVVEHPEAHRVVHLGVGRALTEHMVAGGVDPAGEIGCHHSPFHDTVSARCTHCSAWAT